MDRDDMLLKMYGEMVDDILRADDVRLLIRLPEGTMEPEIQSSFKVNDLQSILEFYIMLHGLKKVMQLVMSLDMVDPDKKELMIDGMLQMVKDELMEED